MICRHIFILVLLVPATLAFAATEVTNGPLHFAAVQGDFEKIQLLLAEGTPIDQPGHIGNSPLQHVITAPRMSDAKRLAVVNFLIEHGADLNFRNHWNKTPLVMSSGRDISITKRLVEAGADVNAAGDSPLSGYLSKQTSADEFAELLALMLAAGIDVNNGSLLLDAARLRPAVVDDLIAAGADVNIASKYGQTALHIASALKMEEHPDMVEATTALLEAGANVEALDNRGNTPLIMASVDGTRLLLAGGASVAWSGTGQPAVFAAVIGSGQPTLDRVDMLLAAEADPRAVWRGNRAIDQSFISLRNNYKSYGRAREARAMHLDVIKRLVAAGGGEWIDKIAVTLGLHPARLRYYQYYTQFLGLAYAAPLSLALIAFVFACLSAFRDKRWIRTLRSAAWRSFIGTALLFFFGTLWLLENADTYLPLVFFWIFGWAASVFQLVVWLAISTRRPVTT